MGSAENCDQSMVGNGRDGPGCLDMGLIKRMGVGPGTQALEAGTSVLAGPAGSCRTGCRGEAGGESNGVWGKGDAGRAGERSLRNLLTTTSDVRVNIHSIAPN